MSKETVVEDTIKLTDEYSLDIICEPKPGWRIRMGARILDEDYGFSTSAAAGRIAQLYWREIVKADQHLRAEQRARRMAFAFSI